MFYTTAFSSPKLNGVIRQAGRCRRLSKSGKMVVLNGVAVKMGDTEPGIKRTVTRCGDKHSYDSKKNERNDPRAKSDSEVLFLRILSEMECCDPESD
jgi:hypothetical protein